MGNDNSKTENDKSQKPNQPDDLMQEEILKKRLALLGLSQVEVPQNSSAAPTNVPVVISSKPTVEKVEQAKTESKLNKPEPKEEIKPENIKVNNLEKQQENNVAEKNIPIEHRTLSKIFRVSLKEQPNFILLEEFQKVNEFTLNDVDTIITILSQYPTFVAN